MGLGGLLLSPICIMDIGRSTEYINKLYDNLSFFELHFQSILIVLLMSVIVILIATAGRIYSKSNVIKQNWKDERCKPNIMPFAGLINKPVGQTIAEYTITNFNHCVNNILLDNFKKSPSFDFAGAASGLSTGLSTGLSNSFDFAGASNGLIDSALDVDISFNTSFDLFSKLQNDINNAFESVKNKVSNSMVPVQQSIYAVNDMFYRMQAIFIAGIYTSLGNSLMLKSLMTQFLQSISKIFYLLLVVITALFIIPGTQGLAIATTAVAMPLLVATASINLTMGRAMGITPGKLPSINKCFDKHTLLQMKSGEYKQINQIKIGDQLFDSSIVTATIILDSKHVTMYNVHGVIVSGFHRIKQEGEWISVSKYQYAREINKYNEKYIYCINTTNKIINVAGLYFLDWDELYDVHLINILKHAGVRHSSSLHATLDGGFCEDTPIRLLDKRILCVKDIIPGDVLTNGALVYGVVKIKQDDMSISEFNLGQRSATFRGGSNLVFYDSGGKLHSTLNKSDILKNPLHRINKLNYSGQLYHLLTDTQTFYVGNVKFGDYNSLIDTILANIIC